MVTVEHLLVGAYLLVVLLLVNIGVYLAKILNELRVANDRQYE